MEVYIHTFMILRVQNERCFSAKRDAMLYEIAKKQQRKCTEPVCKLILSAHFIYILSPHFRLEGSATKYLLCKI